MLQRIHISLQRLFAFQALQTMGAIRHIGEPQDRLHTLGDTYRMMQAMGLLTPDDMANLLGLDGLEKLEMLEPGRPVWSELAAAFRRAIQEQRRADQQGPQDAGAPAEAPADS